MEGSGSWMGQVHGGVRFMKGSGSWRGQVHGGFRFIGGVSFKGGVRLMEGSDLWRGQIYEGSDSKQGSDIRRDQILGWSHIHRLGVRFMEGSDS